MQILVNLLSNAVKFSSKGDVVDLYVEIDQDGAVLISVADTGPGIPEADLDRIFLPFQQVDSSKSRPRGGTGLGIPIAHAFACLHGGDLTLKSELGVGTVASLKLPAERIAAYEGGAHVELSSA